MSGDDDWRTWLTRRQSQVRRHERITTLFAREYGTTFPDGYGLVWSGGEPYFGSCVALDGDGKVRRMSLEVLAKDHPPENCHAVWLVEWHRAKKILRNARALDSSSSDGPTIELDPDWIGAT